MEDLRTDYRSAYDAWMAELARLHSILLDGERLEPPKLKGLLNREARAKETYDEARRRLLGLSE